MEVCKVLFAQADVDKDGLLTFDEHEQFVRSAALAMRTDIDKIPSAKEMRLTNLSLNSRDVRIDIGIKFRRMCGKDGAEENKVSWNTLWMKDLKDNKPKSKEKVVIKRRSPIRLMKKDSNADLNDRLGLGETFKPEMKRPLRPLSGVKKE